MEIQMLTVPKAARQTGLPESVLRRLCDEKKVRSIRSGTRRYIDLLDLKQYIHKSNEEEPPH